MERRYAKVNQRPSTDVVIFFSENSITIKRNTMKKWLFSTLILSWQTVALAQQSTVTAPPAQHIFDEAFRHLNGLGRSYDKQKAVALFKEAAELGNGASLNALGNLHATGEAGLSKDIDAALDYYQKAGKAGYG